MRDRIPYFYYRFVHRYQAPDSLGDILSLAATKTMQVVYNSTEVITKRIDGCIFCTTPAP